MRTEQFQKLLAEYLEKTSNIRALDTKWSSGVSRIPDEIASKIGSIVSLLQAKIQEGFFCKKDEYLMIYNFQPLHISEDDYLCSLDMVIRPASEIDDLSSCKGIPLQLVVNGTTGEVGNNAYGMVAMELISEDEADADEEVPVIYGNYKDYPEPEQQDLSKKLSTVLQAISATSKKEEIKVGKELEELGITEVCFSFQQKIRATVGTALTILTPLTPSTPDSPSDSPSLTPLTPDSPSFLEEFAPLSHITETRAVLS